jgi:hypothetical protein
VFMLIGAMAAASLMSVLMVPAAAIDHARARGLRDGDEANAGKPSGYRVLLTCRPLLIFVLCAVLFHFANVAMLPLVGQKLALQDSKLGTSLMSACIVAAQIVMVPMAILVGRRADVWGASRCSSPASSFCQSAGFFTHCQTNHTGWSAYNCSTAWAPASMELCFPSRVCAFVR